MTINKRQRPTLENICIHLPFSVFSHGQLHIALSRVRSSRGIHIVLYNDATLPSESTRNMVYHEIFTDLPLHTQFNGSTAYL
ncbi:hypothetical protein LINGRAHAP2_LOCUS2824 [Linum grandiflorum]